MMSTTCFYSMKDSFLISKVRVIFNSKQSKIIETFKLIGFSHLEKNILNILIRDYQEQRFELPYSELFRHHQQFYQNSDPNFTKEQSNFFVSVAQQSNHDKILDTLDEEQTFQVKIAMRSKDRSSLTEHIIDTSVQAGQELNFESSFYYGEQFIQFSTHLDFESNELYGLLDTQGTSNDKIRMDTSQPKKYVFWDDHNDVPFFTVLNKKSKQAHGIFILTSNPCEIQTLPKQKRLLIRILGNGIFNMFVYGGPTMKDVIQQHYQTIGQPQLPPYYALGYQQSRDNYRLQDIHKVSESFQINNIPLDVFWNYLDYLRAQPFQIDSDQFNEILFRDQIRSLHQRDIKYGLAILPGLSYTATDSAKQFMRFQYEGSHQVIFAQFSDKVSGAIPNFFNEATRTKWRQEVRDIMAKLNLDCFWLDKNQIFQRQIMTFNEANLTPPNLNFIFTPGGIDIQSNTLPLNAFVNATVNIQKQNFNNTLIEDIFEIDQHLIFRLIQAKNTYETMNQVQSIQRPFMISTAYFAGMSQLTAKFELIQRSDWQGLKLAYIYNLKNQLNGAFISGSSVCGVTGGNLIEDDLCIRWHQMQAISSPLMRNHYSKVVSQEPYSISIQSTQYLKLAIELRYSLISYMNSLLMHSINEENLPIMRTILMEFPNEIAIDSTDIYNLDENQFMLGSSLLVSPVMTQGSSLTNQNIMHSVYFPQSSLNLSESYVLTSFYDIFEGSMIPVRGQSYQIKISSIGDIPMYIRGGSIITFQNVTKQNKKAEGRQQQVLNTVDLKNKMGVDLLIAFDQPVQTVDKQVEKIIIKSNGYYYLDDGQSAQEKKAYNRYDLSAQVIINLQNQSPEDKFTLNITIDKSHAGYDNMIDQENDVIKRNFQDIYIYGLSQIIGAGSINTKNISAQLMKLSINNIDEQVKDKQPQIQMINDQIVCIKNILKEFQSKQQRLEALIQLH
eukprot:403350105